MLVRRSLNFINVEVQPRKRMTDSVLSSDPLCTLANFKQYSFGLTQYAVGYGPLNRPYVSGRRPMDKPLTSFAVPRVQSSSSGSNTAKLGAHVGC